MLNNWVLGLILLLTFLLRLPYFSQPLDYDEGYMAFSGFYSSGKEFYPSLEAFPTSGRLPGTIFIYRLLDILFPKNFVFIRVISTLFVLLGVFMMFNVGKLLRNKLFGYWSALLFATFSSQISLASPADSEFFMTPLVITSFYYFLLFVKNKKNLSIFLSGIFGGLAFLIKQPAIFELFLLFIWLLFILVNNGENDKVIGLTKNRIKTIKKLYPLIIFSVALITPLLMTIIIFFLKGQLSSLWLQGFGAGGSYVLSAWKGNMWQARFVQIIRIFKKLYWIFFLFGIGGSYLILKNKIRNLYFVLFWFLLTFIGASFTGYFFDHYYVAIVPPLSLLGGFFLFNFVDCLRNWSFKVVFIVLVLILMLKYSFPSLISYSKWKIGSISQINHWQNIGQDVGAAGWLPLIDSANFLKGQMGTKDTFFAWATIPTTYYLINNRPSIDFFNYYQVLNNEFMLPTYKSFKFDFVGNRVKLMKKLTLAFPTYILFYVNPEQVYDQLFLFKDFSNFLSNNYNFVKQFGHVIIFEINSTKIVTTFNKEEVSIPLELVKRYSGINNIENTKNGKIVSFEPMVNPNGILRLFKSVYQDQQEIKFTSLTPQTFEIGKEDLVGFATDKPSGTPDLHIRVKGLSTVTSFIRVKIGDFAWNSRSYGVNPIIKVIQNNDIFDLYLEPVKIKKGQDVELYFIYENGQIGVERIQLE